jgi:hypothetical protein
MATALNDMTKAEARVAVAKDVLKWIDAGKLDVRHETYFYANREMRGDDGLLRDELAELGPCEVCAICAMFYAQVALFNGLKSRDAVRPFGRVIPTYVLFES